VCRFPEVGQRSIELGGVLPHVQPDGAEAERLDLAPNRPHKSRGNRHAPRGDQGIFDEPEIGNERIR